MPFQRTVVSTWFSIVSVFPFGTPCYNLQRQSEIIRLHLHYNIDSRCKSNPWPDPAVAEMSIICWNIHNSYSPHPELPSTVYCPNPTRQEDSLTAALWGFTSTLVCTSHEPHSPSSASCEQFTIPAPTVRVLVYKLSKPAASLTFWNHLLLHPWKKKTNRWMLGIPLCSELRRFGRRHMD